MSDQFKLDEPPINAAAAAAYRKARGSVPVAEPIAEAVVVELARQIEADGGPSGSLEEQVRAMLGSWIAAQPKPGACPDCNGDGGELVDQCTCAAWSECPTCTGFGEAGR